MSEERAKRKLSAILSADVKGYSRLMQDDEPSTIQTLKAYRKLMASLVQEYRGRVVDSPGDNVLSEFGSVVDAVECAVKIQRELKEKNAKFPENRKMEFRIGVNLGDVIEDEDRIYGDGVNIAARVEGVAEGGGICISGSAYEQVRNKLMVGYEYLGDHTVKNIAQPVKVYQILLEPEYVGKLIGEEKTKRKRWGWALTGAAVVVLIAGGVSIWQFYFRLPSVEPASVEKMAFPLPEKPSIAVLPFDNMSGDPKQEYIADGLTENIITGLSQIPEIFVIARNSVFTYKEKPVKIRQVSEELGVKYVLEGSIQKEGDRLRVNAQLIDALKGHHLWAERYDRDMQDLFALQDEITLNVVEVLQVTLTEGEQARIWQKHTDNLEAWSHFTKAREHFLRVTKGDNEIARGLLRKAVELDPRYASAWVRLAWTHLQDARFGFSESRAESFERAVELAQKALALDDSNPETYMLLSQLHVINKEHEQAIAQAEKAVELSPNHADATASLGHTLTYSGQPEVAARLMKRAMRLSPYYPLWYLVTLGHALRLAGQYEEAIFAFKKALQRNPHSHWPHANLAIIYIELGREQEARAAVAEVLRLYPTYSLEIWGKRRYYKDRAVLERDLDALRKAGIPDKPPKKASD